MTRTVKVSTVKLKHHTPFVPSHAQGLAACFGFLPTKTGENKRNKRREESKKMQRAKKATSSIGSAKVPLSPLLPPSPLQKA